MNKNKYIDIFESRVSRRKFIFLSSSLSLISACELKNPFNLLKEQKKPEAFLYTNPLFHQTTQTAIVSSDYSANLLISWQDKLSDQDEILEFGYNNDFIAYFPIDKKQNSQHGILSINHEYANEELIFSSTSPLSTAEKNTLMMNLVGNSIIEVKKDEQNIWHYVKNSKFNRRVTAFTECKIEGYAKNNNLLKTQNSQNGEISIGTFANCAGGKTPWHTVLTAEENINHYFKAPETFLDKSEEARVNRFKIHDNPKNSWYKTKPYFDLQTDRNSANLYGYIVEIDPYNPTKTPIKRTPLGRFKHECAYVTLSNDNKIVVYMADDQEDEDIYKYVSTEIYDESLENPGDLLNNGILYAARFKEDDILWMPLVFSDGLLNKHNGFHSQGDIVIDARFAADILGATKMPRPEGITENKSTGEIFIALTGDQHKNHNGHIIKINTNKDHNAKQSKWEIILTGQQSPPLPSGEGLGVRDIGTHNDKVTQDTLWLSNPDNLNFNHQTNELLITTHGMYKNHQIADGLYTFKDSTLSQILAAPIGSEVTGPEVTPDGKTTFISIQHPGEDSTYDNPSTRWPDFNQNHPPRPSVITLEKK